ncbi:hypothetical protein JZ751_018782 [Albula glossodonta]|uniref:Uncharacterized protein n=1 Tax=Albula glossodonta TaxID=121402 RepID=A0A8T2NW56_9TELE|nr:hypothetical protein JZ751_018782 [Albula glossodonta]
MDGTSLSSHSSSAEPEPGSQDSSTFQSPQEHSEVQRHTITKAADAVSQGDRLLSEEEQVTLITESMLITSADEEKLLLLNKNTELRRLNKELMKLNEEWDSIYRSTTLGLEQRLGVLDQENSTLKQLNGRLLLKVEHEQSKREYYEQTLLQELKKNQHLQEHIRLLETRLHHVSADRDWSGGMMNGLEIARPPETGSPPEPSHGQCQGTSCYPPPASSGRRSRSQVHRSASCREADEDGVTLKEVQDLKEQLEALRCQTRIYEADYKTEHKDRQRMVQENKKLRRKEGEMRQQMALLQEQQTTRLAGVCHGTVS